MGTVFYQYWSNIYSFEVGLQHIVIMVVCKDSWFKHYKILDTYHTSNESFVFNCDMVSFLSTLSAKSYIFQIIFISFLRYSGGTGLDATCAGSGVALSGWGTTNHWGGGSNLHPNLYAQSSPNDLLGAPTRAAHSVKPSCIPIWESASGPQLLPTLGHHNFSSFTQ